MSKQTSEQKQVKAGDDNEVEGSQQSTESKMEAAKRAHLPWGQQRKKKLFAWVDGSSRVRDDGREEEVPGAGTTATKKQATSG